jgi:hypothetical protein
MFAKGRIDLTKIREDWIFEGKNGARYLDFTIKDSKEIKWGQDLMVTQDVPKAEREAGTKWGPILGNGKNLETDQQQSRPAPTAGSTPTSRPRPPAQRPPPRQTQAPGSPVIHEAPQDDDVPF